MSAPRPAVLSAVGVAAAMVLAGCAAGSELGSATPEQPRTSLPTAETTIVAGGDPASLAIATSQALFDQAPVVALASEDDLDGQQDASAFTEQLGTPLLLVPTGGEPAELGAELQRLDPAAVVPFDAAAADWAHGAEVTAEVVAADDELPPTSPAEPLGSLLVLSLDDEASFAATATARASGARVLAVSSPDPRADPAAIEALAAEPAGTVAALGDGFGPPEQLRHRLSVAATGAQLPGGGQLVYPGRRMVALYGHPGSTELGALGEQPLREAIERTKETAAAYQELVDEPVVPTFEIITTVAASQPGPDGDYTVTTPVEELRPWVEAAADEGIYVVLDLQPGRTDFLSQAVRYEELLAEPHVGLALDPEWRLAPDQVHLEQIGSVSAEEVNEVAQWLAELTRDRALPQKLLVLHQFRLSMITDREELDTSFDELAVLIHADGHGTEAQKLETWQALHADAPDGLWWGWKNFYDEDQPTLSPEQTVAVEPSPLFVSYQ